MSRPGCPAHGTAYLRVRQRKSNHSAFNGYRYTPSAYSTIICTAADCPYSGRTKARYVDSVPDEDR